MLAVSLFGVVPTFAKVSKLLVILHVRGAS